MVRLAWGMSGMVLCCHQTTSFQIDILRDPLLIVVDFACTGEEWVSNKERIASNGHASTSMLYVSDVTPSSTMQHPGSYTGPAVEGAYMPYPQLLTAVYSCGLPAITMVCQTVWTATSSSRHIPVSISTGTHCLQGCRVPRLLCEILTGPGTTTPLHCALQRFGHSS